MVFRVLLGREAQKILSVSLEGAGRVEPPWDKGKNDGLKERVRENYHRFEGVALGGGKE